MLYIVKVSRQASQNARVVLSDGRSAKVPRDLAVWGAGFSEDDFVQVNLSLGKDCWHVSMVRKDFTSGKELFRGYEGFDAKAELGLIRKYILQSYRRVFGGFWASDQLEDFTLEVFLHLWARDCFRRHDASRSSYEAYLRSAVHNCLVDISRSVTVQQFRSYLSLDYPVNADGEKLVDVLRDMTNQDVVEKLQADALYERMQVRVLELDSVGSGLPGFTFKAIFDALVTGTIGDFAQSYPYGRGVLDTYISKLRGELEFVCSEFAS